MSLDQDQFNQIFINLKDFFQSIDKDNDGIISSEELTDFLIQDGIRTDSIPHIKKVSSK